MSNYELKDTYYAALQHEKISPDESDLVLGVVRHPMYGIEEYLDENKRVLAPSEELLSEVKELASDIGHNEAWQETNFESRYREFLQNEEQQGAMEWVLSQLEQRNVWLVCYENTEKKECHRTVLKQELLKMREQFTQ